MWSFCAWFLTPSRMFSGLLHAVARAGASFLSKIPLYRHTALWLSIYPLLDTYSLLINHTFGNKLTWNFYCDFYLIMVKLGWRAEKGVGRKEVGGRRRAGLPQTIFNFFLISPRLGPHGAQGCGAETSGPFGSQRIGPPQAADGANVQPRRVPSRLLCSSPEEAPLFPDRSSAAL